MVLSVIPLSSAMALPEPLVITSSLRSVKAMSDELLQLIEAARHFPFSDEEREAQRRSFAYGNTYIENERVREMVDEQAELLKLESQTR
jgi:hypothetical protein